MSATFYASEDVCLWFSAWRVTSGGEYFLAMLLLIVLAFIREWLSEARNLAYVRRLQHQRRRSKGLSDEDAKDMASSGSASFSGAVHDSIYYFFTLSLGYLLMLAVMTYNVGFTFTVIIASAVGRFTTPWVVRRCFKS